MTNTRQGFNGPCHFFKILFENILCFMFLNGILKRTLRSQKGKLNKMKALTRNQIMELWKSQEKEILELFCCPCCRYILGLKDNLIHKSDLKCINGTCSNEYIYSRNTGEQIG